MSLIKSNAAENFIILTCLDQINALILTICVWGNFSDCLRCFTRNTIGTLFAVTTVCILVCSHCLQLLLYAYLCVHTVLTSCALMYSLCSGSLRLWSAKHPVSAAHTGSIQALQPRGQWTDNCHACAAWHEPVQTGEQTYSYVSVAVKNSIFVRLLEDSGWNIHIYLCKKFFFKEYVYIKMATQCPCESWKNLSLCNTILFHLSS